MSAASSTPPDVSAWSITSPSISRCLTSQSTMQLKWSLMLMLILLALAVRAKKLNRDIYQEEENAMDGITTRKRITESRQSITCRFPNDSKLQEIYFRFFNVGTRFYWYQDAELPEADKILHHVRWNPKLPMVLLIHGQYDHPYDSLNMGLTKAYSIYNNQYNLVLLNWYSVAGTNWWFPKVVFLDDIATRVAKALSLMLKKGALLDHIVGHGLGAHLAGAVSRLLPNTIPLVVGLDPARDVCGVRLRASDAPCVLVLHSDQGREGSVGPSGTVDFFPNGGFRRQPGCSWMGPIEKRCSHEHSVYIWIAMISGHTGFYGRKCSSWEDFIGEKCDAEEVLKLGPTCSGKNGSFFMWTASNYPHVFGRRGSMGSRPTDGEYFL